MPPFRIVAPLVAAFILFLVIIVNAVRVSGAERVPATPAPGFGASVGGLLRMATGGYLVFLAIVFVFHAALAGERAAIANALTNGSLLAFVVVVPSFLALSSAERMLVRRHRRRS